MEFLYEYGLFLAKAATLVVAGLLLIGSAVAMGQRQKGRPEGHIEIRNLNQRYLGFREFMEEQMLPRGEFKSLRKRRRGQDRKRRKRAEPGRRLYVLNFEGNLKASATEDLREEVSAVLSVAGGDDEVLLRLESEGGLVHGHGLAASQLQRVRDAGIPLVVAVDRVAASGGYMMACVAERILAAPFAVLGSIGVLAQLPNFHRLLKSANVDFEQHTAGEYKRSVTLFGENTAEDRARLQAELDDTHLLFKQFVAERRARLDIDSVATGEVWYGQRALERGLVDELLTSDSYIQSAMAGREVFEVRHVRKKSWQEKLGLAVEGALHRGLPRLWRRWLAPRQF